MRITNTNKKIKQLLAGTALSLMVLFLTTTTAGCKPGQFLQRNACELLNCDVLFFVDDIFPLAAQSGGGTGGGGGGGASEPSEEEEGGGHLH